MNTLCFFSADLFSLDMYGNLNPITEKFFHSKILLEKGLGNKMSMAFSPTLIRLEKAHKRLNKPLIRSFFLL